MSSVPLPIFDFDSRRGEGVSGSSTQQRWVRRGAYSVRSAWVPACTAFRFSSLPRTHSWGFLAFMGLSFWATASAHRHVVSIHNVGKLYRLSRGHGAIA